MERVLAIAQSPVYSRKRRQVNNPTPTHASMLSASSTFDILDTASSESVDTTRSEIVHDSLVTTTSSAHDGTTILHDATEVSVVSDSPLSISVLFAVSDTNIPSELTNAPSTSPPTEVPQTSEDTTIAYTTLKTPDPVSTAFVSTDEPIISISSISTNKPSTITTKSYEDFIIEQESIDSKSSTKSEKLTSPIDDVLKITGEIPEDVPVDVEAPEHVKKSEALHESNSMKPSNVESPDVIQHDFPVYAYGQDEVEIVNLKPEFSSTTIKTKDVNQKKSPDKNLLDNDVKNRSLKEAKVSENITITEDTSEELETLNLPHTKIVSDVIDSEPSETKVRINTHGFNEFTQSNSSLSVTSEHKSDSNNPNIHSSPTKVQVVNIPSTDTSRHAKRVFVNVTIAAEPDANYPNQNQPFYVLSVSVPTDGNPNSFPGINIGNINPMYLESSSTDISSTELTSSTSDSSNTSLSSKSPDTPTPLVRTHRPYNFWGGECQCSCPCLDEQTTSTTVDSLLIEAENNSTSLSSAITNSSTSDELLLDSISDIYNSTDIYYSSTWETTLDDLDSSSSTTQTSEGWSSTDVSACPEVTTALPPPPTILILEGREKS